MSDICGKAAVADHSSDSVDGVVSVGVIGVEVTHVG